MNPMNIATQKKMSPEMVKVKSPNATDAELETLKDCAELEVAEIAFNRIQARKYQASLG